MGVGLKVSITQNSQNIENYTSNVTVTVDVSWGSGSYNHNVCYGTATIDGTNYSFSGSFNSDETTSGSKTLLSKTFDVEHDTSTGKRTVQVSASYNTETKWGTITASKSLELTALPLRYTLSISAGTGSTITVNRTSSPQAGASIGPLSEGATIYDYDVLQIIGGAEEGYKLDGLLLNGSKFYNGRTHTVSGDVLVSASASVSDESVSDGNYTLIGTCFLYGNGSSGGGSDLNFKVVGGLDQPTNPAENTIWVNTGTEIIGWAFSISEPESPAEGMVWIKTRFGSSVPFNALKKNCLHVYPISVWQYASGAWAEKTAMIYADGTWSLVRALKEYLVQAGVIDMTAHAHTSTDNKYTAKNNVEYASKPSLALQGSNGGQKYHYFANVTVPEWAKTMKIECYRLAAYAAAPKFTIGSTSVTVPKTAKIMYNITASIDVEAIAGRTETFSVLVCGYADCYYSNIGNVWFE